MKRRILTMLGIIAIPVGAILLNSCGPEAVTDSEVTLDEASDNWIFLDGWFSEYGACNDTLENDGDGLVDSHDPDCHINPGPMRDLSLFDFPQGHNYFPDITMDIPGGPGFDGGFRDIDLITRWFKFLDEPDGDIAGIDVYDPGVNPALVPIPAFADAPIPLGTFHQGNNNNPSVRSLHVVDLYHPAIVIPPAPVVDGVAALQAPADTAVVGPLDPSARYNHNFNETLPPRGGWPGVMYTAQGPFSYDGVAQSALRSARAGGPR